ncbi:universal stress protein [Helicobacter sp. 13S00401-1]|uniref:universal stress protein n=1 Tax=Helicobacter sp. 13S00401-1 TaxID=1905758 RepID=UPI000BA6A438|nr:universal stress protein [Helicobacter sp. 13S00401-1]PAF50744.1 universal stress protein [Helicobacter sp. 13S00401-1]
MLKVLFGVSDTEECKKAIPAIMKIFGHREDVVVHLMHVVANTVVFAESGIVDYSAIEEPQEEESNEVLNYFADTLTKEGVRCKRYLRHGDPIDIILEESHMHDLLVIGDSEHSFLHKVFSSHGSSFIHNSPIPVLIAK